MSTRDYENETWEEWDDGTLGTSEEHAIASESDTQAVDAALGLQAISLRMPGDLLEDLKLIARLHGIGYQPLMKQILQRFVTEEMKVLLREAAEREEARKALSAQENVPEKPRKRA